MREVKDTAIWPAFKGFWDGLMSDGKNWILGTIGKIGSWFEKSFFGPIAKAIFSAMALNTLLGAARGFFKDGESSLITELAKSAKWVATSIGGLIPALGNDGLGAVIGTSTSLWDGLQGVLSWAKSISGPLTAVTIAVASLTSSYGGLGGVLDRIKQVFSDA